jgi:hypothetical protein
MYNDQQSSMTINNDLYLPAESVLLTDFEEQRLAEQIRQQLSHPTVVDRLKLFYQELSVHDPTRSNYVHHSIIRSIANQLGVSPFLMNVQHFRCVSSSYICMMTHFALPCVNSFHRVKRMAWSIMKI